MAEALAGSARARLARVARAGGLTGWIAAQARRTRAWRSAPGAAKELAERIGGFVSEGDAERRYQTRTASMELDKLALYRETGADHRRRRPGAGGGSGPGLDLGIQRCRRRAEDGSGAGAARAPARDGPGTGPDHGPPPADPRAARDRRPAGVRGAASRGRQGDGLTANSVREPCRAGARLDDRPSCTPRSTACSSSTR